MRLVLVASFLLLAPALAHDPTGVVVAPNGRIYVADPYRCRIFEVTPEGQVTHFAGSAAGRGSVDGPRLEARFGDPHGLACSPDGVLYVTDYSTNRVRKIGVDGGVVTIAGSGASQGYRDGPGPQALFQGINGIAVDPKGNVFVADTWNNRVRRIEDSGTVSTLAGSESGMKDGRAAEARFSHPVGLALASDGTLYVADAGNHAVRTISTRGFVGTLIYGTAKDKRPTGGLQWFPLVEPWGVAVAPDGTVWVADGGAGFVARLGPCSGTVAPLTPLRVVDLPATRPSPEWRSQPFDRPCGVAFDREGVLYALDHFTGPGLVLSRVSLDRTALTTLVNFEGQPGGR